MSNLTHLSLFSGIGGLDLAAEWAGFETVGQCEWADYPTKVLEKHWPDVPRWRDIHDLRADDFRARTGIESPTVVSGGFPCQPHSLAGKRKASADERDLWPEYRRVVSELKPRWVVAENVRGLLTSEDGRFFRGILRDFADMGFDVGWCTYPAAWVGAVHRRERVFTIAYASSFRLEKQMDINGCLNQISYKWTPNTLSGCFEELRIDEHPSDKELRNDDGATNWVDRLKCLGNMVMPQQATPIFQAIAEIELTHKNSRHDSGEEDI